MDSLGQVGNNPIHHNYTNSNGNLTSLDEKTYTTYVDNKERISFTGPFERISLTEKSSLEAPRVAETVAAVASQVLGSPEIATLLSEVDRAQEAFIQAELKQAQDVLALSQCTSLSDLKIKSKQLRTNANSTNEAAFKALESALHKLSECHNKLPAQSSRKAQLQTKIEQCNTALQSRNLSTHPISIAKGQVLSFLAVRMKFLQLQEEKQGIQKQLQGKLPIWKRLVLNYQLLKVDRKIGKMPKEEALKEIKKLIEAELRNSATKGVLDPKAAKAANRAYPALKAGASHLPLSLTLPSNWTNIYSCTVKTSREGNAYVCSTINEPLLVEEKGGVPSSLRPHKEFASRPANLMKVTSYIAGMEDKKRVFFRGGQLPSQEAAKTVLQALGEPKKVHFNALLTPVAVGREDKSLLRAHKAHIAASAKELQRPDPIVSNFGVNEGAIGELPFRMKLAWPTAIAQYGNPAVEQLHTLLRQVNLHQSLDSLGAILQVGKEMEAIWAKNDYADGRIGENQFKFPALWATLDTLLGFTCYTNCKSGKDRTGGVVGTALHYLNEIDMNVADQKKKLKEVVDDYNDKNPGNPLSSELEQKLTSACFSVEEVKKLLRDRSPGTLGTYITQAIDAKIQTVKNLLEKESGMLEQKAVKGMTLKGISKQEVTASENTLPQLAVPSVYNTEIASKEAQRLAKNRRADLIGVLPITQMNTSRSGLKMQGSLPFVSVTAGFDETFALGQLLAGEQDLDELLGLKELGSAQQNKYKKEIGEAQEIVSQDKKKEKLAAIIHAIAEDKAKGIIPKDTVKS